MPFVEMRSAEYTSTKSLNFEMQIDRMQNKELPLKLEKIKSYFGTGATRPYAFRVQQLKALKAAVQQQTIIMI